MIAAGDVTSYLVGYMAIQATLEDCPYDGVLVGDGVAPDDAGWLTGQPNASEFTPYIVIKPGGPVSTMQGVPLDDSSAIWFPMPYSMTAYHNDRVSADRLAQWSRTALKRERGPQTVGDLTVKMHQTAIDSLALAVRDDSTFPKLWSSTTNLHLNVARAHAPK